MSKRRKSCQSLRVLVSDELSVSSIQIFRDRGIDVDFRPEIGKNKEEMARIIGDYDGLAVRFTTKVTENLLSKAKNLKGLVELVLG